MLPNKNSFAFLFLHDWIFQHYKSCLNFVLPLFNTVTSAFFMFTSDLKYIHIALQSIFFIICFSICFKINWHLNGFIFLFTPFCDSVSWIWPILFLSYDFELFIKFYIIYQCLFRSAEFDLHLWQQTVANTRLQAQSTLLFLLRYAIIFCFFVFCFFCKLPIACAIHIFLVLFFSLNF